LLSCQKDDTNAENEGLGNSPQPELEGLLLDGGRIGGMSLFCIPNRQTTFGEPWWVYYSKTKTMKDYADFKLLIMVREGASVYQSDDTHEMSDIIALEQEYEKGKSAFILEDYRDYEKTNNVECEWPNFYTAYINGDVSITCDRTLYGESPGTSLNKHLRVDPRNGCLPVGVENPRLLYGFGDEIPARMDSLLVKEAWLQYQYWLTFIGQPAEKYDSLTLFLSFPLKMEHLRDYAVAKYKGRQQPPRYTEAVFKSRCPIKFEF